MFATAVSYMGLCVPRLLQASEEDIGSDGDIGLDVFLILLFILMLLFWAIHLCKDDDDVFGNIDQELVNNFTEGVHLYYSYLQRLEELMLHMEDLTSEVDLDSCSDSQSCRPSFISHSRSHGDDKYSHHGSTRASRSSSCSSSCSSSRYVTPSDSPLPLEYQPCPHQLTAIGWRLNCTLMEAKLDSPVAVPVAAASTVTGCKDRAAGRTDRADCSRTPTVRHIPMMRQLFEAVPRKGDPDVLCCWHRRHLELNVTQKVGRKRWRIAVLMISIVRWLLPERLKGGGTTSSTSTSASTPTTTTTLFNTSATSQAKNGSKIIRKTASVPVFCPQGANPPSPSQAPCQSPELEGKPKSIMMYAQGARIPFISQEVREKLESHVCRKQSQRLWGFPKLVTRYVGDLVPQQLPTSCSAGDGKIMCNVTDRQAVFSRRAHCNNKTTRPAEEPEATAAIAAAAAKDSSPATRPVEKTTTTSTMLQPAETHSTKPPQTRPSLNQTSPVMSLTPERRWLEEKVRSKCMEVKLKHFPGIEAQSYHSTLASATSQPTRKPTQVAEAPTVVRKRPAPLRRRDKVLFIDQEDMRCLEDNLIMKHMEHLQRQGVTTASTSSAHTQGVTTTSASPQSSHSLALETSTHTATVSHPNPALIKQLVRVNGLEGGVGERKTLLAPQQHQVKPSSAAAKVVSGLADSAVSSSTEAQRSSFE